MTVVLPAMLVAETTVSGLPDRFTAVMWLKVADPVVVRPLMAYVLSLAGMVSAGESVPVVKSVEETVVVQAAPKPRLSVTWTSPSWAVADPPGAVAPRLALAEVVMDSDPLRTSTLTVHELLLVPGGQLLPGTGEMTVLVRIAFAVLGLVMVTV